MGSQQMTSTTRTLSPLLTRPDHATRLDLRLRRGQGHAVTALEELEEKLRMRLDALGPAPRAELRRALELPDYERAGTIGELYLDGRTRTFAELLIDLEEDPAARGVV